MHSLTVSESEKACCYILMAVALTSQMTIYTDLISWVYESIGQGGLQKGVDFGSKVTDKTLGND